MNTSATNETLSNKYRNNEDNFLPGDSYADQ